MDINSNNIYGSRLGEGIDFRYIHETKFKISCISVHLLVPMTRENVTVNAVLSGLLRRTCGKYPEFQQMRRRLAMLYGADASGSFCSLGNCQMLTLEIMMLDDRFIPNGETIAAECADLLCEMLFRPAREADGSLFREEDLRHAIKLAEERIASRINDKGDYALHRCLDEMCAGEPLGLEPGGYPEDLPNVTREALAQAWQELLRTAAVNIVMVGAGDHTAVERRFREEFGRIERAFAPLPEPVIKGRAECEREIVERMDVQQCKMVIGMRLPIAEPNDDTMPARVMSMLYGNGVNSLLFQNVREKLSLCYYCSSSFARKHGVMLVSCGLEETNYAAALSEIRKQLAVIADNAFTDEEFEAIRRAAVNDLEESKDSIYAIERWYAMQYGDGCVRTPEQTAERLLAVTRREIADCAAMVTVDTIYLLAPESADAQEAGEAEEGGDMA